MKNLCEEKKEVKHQAEFPIDEDMISSCSSIESDQKAQSVKLA